MKRFMKPDDASLTPGVIGTAYQFFISYEIAQKDVQNQFNEKPGP